MVTFDRIGEVHFRLLGTNGFMKRQRIKDLLLRVRVVVRTSQMKIPVDVWPTTAKNCIKKRAARAKRLFFLIQPIKSLIRGVFVAVPVVVS